MTAPTTLDEWVDRYSELRTARATDASAWLGIPLVVAALIGLLWSVPLPAALSQASPIVNCATLFVMATFVYYCILSVPIALGGLLFLIAATLPAAWLASAGLPIAPVAATVFVPAFAWQLATTRRLTGRLLIARNLQYLMFGPIWLLRAAYRRIGLAY